MASSLSVVAAFPILNLPTTHPGVTRSLNSTCTAGGAATIPNGFGSTVTSSNSLVFFDPTFTNGSNGLPDPQSYTCYSGPDSNFPPISTWMTFIDMFELNQKSNLGPAGDSWPEQTAIYNAILAVSANAKVDARLILAVILQESAGNVRVPCTNNGVQNCGLMQSHDPSDPSFNPYNIQASVSQMVIDGAQGTATGPGLVQLFNEASDPRTTTSGNPYNVVRAYNSGCIDFENLSNAVGATGSYVSDIANRLRGWNGMGEGNVKCGFVDGGSCPI